MFKIKKNERSLTCIFSAMDISELQWHVKQEKQELIKAEEKLDYASTINKAGFRNLLTLF